ncbi:MAG: AAA family ATPase, partial [Thermoleophilaceae bacterium]|nr:AAA family ATPase [Thermoleophilaceae bacterium]MBA3839820.1 AAA family ATPase [Thermoleophilaceae bacterium]
MPLVSAAPQLDPAGVAALAERLQAAVRTAVRVPREVLRDVIVALFAEGHVLIEDYPGVGKTALARALSRSIDSAFARV